MFTIFAEFTAASKSFDLPIFFLTFLKMW